MEWSLARNRPTQPRTFQQCATPFNEQGTARHRDKHQSRVSPLQHQTQPPGRDEEPWTTPGQPEAESIRLQRQHRPASLSPKASPHPPPAQRHPHRQTWRASLPTYHMSRPDLARRRLLAPVSVVRTLIPWKTQAVMLGLGVPCSMRGFAICQWWHDSATWRVQTLFHVEASLRRGIDCCSIHGCGPTAGGTLPGCPPCPPCHGLL